VNFAFSFPTRALPASQRTGDRIIVYTTMLITKESKLIAKISSTLFLKINATSIFKLILQTIAQQMNVHSLIEELLHIIICKVVAWTR
jgi:hypothetical protein